MGACPLLFLPPTWLAALITLAAAAAAPRASAALLMFVAPVAALAEPARSRDRAPPWAPVDRDPLASPVLSVRPDAGPATY